MLTSRQLSAVLHLVAAVVQDFHLSYSILVFVFVLHSMSTIFIYQCTPLCVSLLVDLSIMWKPFCGFLSDISPPDLFDGAEISSMNPSTMPRGDVTGLRVVCPARRCAVQRADDLCRTSEQRKLKVMFSFCCFQKIRSNLPIFDGRLSFVAGLPNVCLRFRGCSTTPIFLNIDSAIFQRLPVDLAQFY